jgi:hypothetical protein
MFCELPDTSQRLGLEHWATDPPCRVCSRENRRQSPIVVRLDQTPRLHAVFAAGAAHAVAALLFSAGREIHLALRARNLFTRRGG